MSMESPADLDALLLQELLSNKALQEYGVTSLNGLMGYFQQQVKMFKSMATGQWFLM